jgi:rod shape determining protein RodA
VANKLKIFFDRGLVYSFEFRILAAVVFVGLLGLLNLWGATTWEYHGDQLSCFCRQLAWFLISLSFMALVSFVNYHTLVYYSFYFHAFSLLFLCLVFFVGKISSGSQRWIEFGPLSFQPSEFAKVTLILILAKILSGGLSDREPRHCVVKPLLAFVPTAALVAIQPDLGTSVTLTLVFFSVLLFTNIPFRRLLRLPLVLILLSPLVWFGLRGYQKDRVIAFMFPNRNKQSIGYQTNQSKIAVGSGRFLGKGLGGGTQGRLRFLPEQHTDFAFSSWSEQFGFFGSVVLTMLYYFIISGFLGVAFRAKDREGFFLIIGICALIFWQVLINTSMTLGMLPVVGITLPFFSYGGSSLLACMVSVGMVINVSMRRFT